MSVRAVFRRLLKEANLADKQPFPRVAIIKAFLPEGCRFEITTALEAFRVESYGDEEEFTRLILEELRPHDVLYDIGACVGLVTVHAAAQGTQVVAFEPDPGFRSRLETNLRLNGLESSFVQVLEWAVSDTQGEATLFTDGVAGYSPSLRQSHTHGRLQVPINSIDAAIAQGRIAPPDVVKIDIEGAEILALRGMRNLLCSSTAPRALFIEMHPGYLAAFDSSIQEVVELLESAGYSKHYEAFRGEQIHCSFRKSTSDG